MGSEIDPAAVETATSKRPLESSSALPEVNPKRPCTTTDNDGDSFEEFFALLQRIEATEKHIYRRRGANRQEPAAKCIQTGTAGDAKPVTTQAPWRPSFEWEDFSPRGNGTRDVDSKSGDGNWKGRERERERERVSPVDGERNLDLNFPVGLIPCD